MARAVGSPDPVAERDRPRLGRSVPAARTAFPPDVYPALGCVTELVGSPRAASPASRRLRAWAAKRWA